MSLSRALRDSKQSSRINRASFKGESFAMASFCPFQDDERCYIEFSSSYHHPGRLINCLRPFLVMRDWIKIFSGLISFSLHERRKPDWNAKTIEGIICLGPGKYIDNGVVVAELIEKGSTTGGFSRAVKAVVPFVYNYFSVYHQPWSPGSPIIPIL